MPLEVGGNKMSDITVDESILKTIKKMSGDNPAFDYYNTDIMVFVNSAIGILQDLGIGNSNFLVTSDEDKWTDFIDDGLALVKDYVFCQVKLSFDPPQNSFLVENLRKKVDELQFRLQVRYENKANATP